jgi:hypothetical protein
MIKYPNSYLPGGGYSGGNESSLSLGGKPKVYGVPSPATPVMVNACRPEIVADEVPVGSPVMGSTSSVKG